MDFTTKLATSVRDHNSLLCVGPDADITRLPAHLRDHPNPQFEFNKAIIDATAEFVCAFKPNAAFFEATGAHGIEQLHQTCHYILEKYPHIPIILDAKRADIGNTNAGYTTFAFEYLKADAVTVHPYMGHEGLQVFLDYADKGIIVLCRTSNPGSGEFQDLVIGGKPLYQHVAATVRDSWNQNGNCLLVVGATYPKELAEVRSIVGNKMTILVPGVGAQGGSIADSLKTGLTPDKDGLIISTSRAVIFASSGEDFADAARREARQLRDTINSYR
jgi:orotidine-5'-phosphate decarboxylase